MKILAIIIATVFLVGCGKFSEHPKFQNSETVQYKVRHMTEPRDVTGTGVVISSSPSDEGWYYVIDIGVNGAGERDQPSLHEKLLSRKK